MRSEPARYDEPDVADAEAVRAERPDDQGLVPMTVSSVPEA